MAVPSGGFPIVLTAPLAPLIGIETGSVRIARQIMAGKALPFDIADWPHIVLNRLEVFSRNNWFPVCTLIVGSPGETDEDCQATLDLLDEVERRGLCAMWVPSIFTPLVRTRMEHSNGIRETQHLSKLQWQVIMKAWAVASWIGLQTTWGKLSFGIGALLAWAARLRRLNGPNFTWTDDRRHRGGARQPTVESPRLRVFTYVGQLLGRPSDRNPTLARSSSSVRI